MADDSTAATLKDVYELVDRTRQETTGQISSLAEKFDLFAQSNEHRLTIVETHQAVQAQQLSEVVNRLDKHGQDIGALKDQQRADEAAAKERTSIFTRRHAVIGMVASAVVAVGTVISIAHF